MVTLQVAREETEPTAKGGSQKTECCVCWGALCSSLLASCVRGRGGVEKVHFANRNESEYEHILQKGK